MGNGISNIRPATISSAVKSKEVEVETPKKQSDEPFLSKNLMNIIFNPNGVSCHQEQQPKNFKPKKFVFNRAQTILTPLSLSKFDHPSIPSANKFFSERNCQIDISKSQKVCTNITTCNNTQKKADGLSHDEKIERAASIFKAYVKNHDDRPKSSSLFQHREIEKFKKEEKNGCHKNVEDIYYSICSPVSQIKIMDTPNRNLYGPMSKKICSDILRAFEIREKQRNSHKFEDFVQKVVPQPMIASQPIIAPIANNYIIRSSKKSKTDQSAIAKGRRHTITINTGNVFIPDLNFRYENFGKKHHNGLAEGLKRYSINPKFDEIQAKAVEIKRKDLLDSSEIVNKSGQEITIVNRDDMKRALNFGQTRLEPTVTLPKRHSSDKFIIRKRCQN